MHYSLIHSPRLIVFSLRKTIFCPHKLPRNSFPLSVRVKVSASSSATQPLRQFQNRVGSSIHLTFISTSYGYCSSSYYATCPIDKQADRSWSACLSFLSETCVFPRALQLRSWTSKQSHRGSACLSFLSERPCFPLCSGRQSQHQVIWEGYKYI